MTTRNREGYSDVSEEFPIDAYPGSFHFSQSQEVDNWCQAVSQGYPPTPPDSVSDLDMSTQWSQPSMPEDQWYPLPSQADPSFAQPAGTSWNAQPMYPSASDYQPLDGYEYATTNQGSVDLGLSPVMSQESQNSHVLHPYPDPEFPLLPPTLDLSFVSDPSWPYSAQVAYNGLQAEQRQLPGNAFVPSPDIRAQRSPHDGAMSQWSTSPGGYQSSAPSVSYSEGFQSQARTMSYPTVAPGRPLLPRTPGLPSSMASAHAPSQRPIRPLIQSRASSRNPAQSVSTSFGQDRGNLVGRRLAPGPIPDIKPRVHSASAVEQGQEPGSATLVRSRTQDMMPLIVDPAAEDFNTFIQYDQEEPAENTPPLSYASGLAPVSSVPSTLSVLDDFQSAVTKDEPGLKPAQITQGAKPIHSGEVDEGRHRNHELYSRGPLKDNLYHCPFKAEEGCPHKPTKLKCNYDKFIDSHLKPFRCKIEACAKQEFSSTACLLRHEREAHGMHGHGERPHLCYYPGCERGYPGNGFPRRYNLFDHMKRVHDHKEDPTSGLGSPDNGSVEASRKPSGRKRKASSPLTDPVSQRHRTSHPGPPQSVQHVTVPTMPLPRQEMSVMPPKVPQASHVPYAVHYPAQVSMPMRPYQPEPVYPGWQQSVHSQWNDQRKELQWQLDHVQSPNDQAGIQRVNHGLLELRRLSQEARRG